MNHRYTWLAYSVAALCLLFAAQQASAASFVPLGAPIPPNTIVTPSSWASDVSADGSVVVGYDGFTAGHYGFTQAFRWTIDGGKVEFGLQQGDFVFRSATGVSADGLVVVGSSYNPGPAVASRWTGESGIDQLGTLPGDTTSTASGVSANGSVVVGGSSSGANGQAFRWTSEGGMIGLGDLPGGNVSSHAFGVSANGSVVVGWSHSEQSNDLGYEAFRWTSDDGMVGLGDLPGGEFRSNAVAASSDGSVIVGWSSASADGEEAFRWTSEGGMVGLGDLPDGPRRSVANDVSADGEVIVGWSTSAIGTEAFIWDAADGMRSLSDVLADLGVDFTGWRLTSASAISADGTSIVGSGINPSGQREAWLANISVPEPSAASVDFVAATLLAASRRTAYFRRHLERRRTYES